MTPEGIRVESRRVSIWAMALLEINFRPSDRELRWFSAIQLAFFLGVAYFVANKAGATTAAGSIAAASSIVAIAGLVAPRLVFPLYIAWMAAAFPIGWAMSHVLLAGVYYLVLTPLGLALRLAGKDLLERQLDRSAKTYWKERDPSPKVERYFKQY